MAEDLALDFSERHAEARNALQGEVASLEPDFARHSQYVRVQTACGVVTVSEPSNEPLALTQPVAVSISGSNIHFFDEKTGRNLAG